MPTTTWKNPTPSAGAPQGHSKSALIYSGHPALWAIKHIKDHDLDRPEGWAPTIIFLEIANIVHFDYFRAQIEYLLLNFLFFIAAFQE